MKTENWPELIGKRLLLTDSIRIARNEWTLLCISPNGEYGKFCNELAGCEFWTDLDKLRVLDILTLEARPA